MDNISAPERTKLKVGYGYATAAYTFWGVAPVYFMWVSFAAPLEVLAYRIVWSVPLLAILITVSRQWRVLTALAPRQLLILALCAALLSINWFTFVYAIQIGRISETALGYFINPLVSIVLGWVFLSEKLRKVQWLCVALAAAGVGYELMSMGSLPWLALTLAATFGFYGLLRKQLAVSSAVGLGIETALLLPVAGSFLLWLILGAEPPERNLQQLITLGLGGVVTVLPLLWFASAAVRVPLTVLGFFQYLAPSMSLLIALFIYDESVSDSRWICFMGIWLSLAIYSIEGIYQRRSN